MVESIIIDAVFIDFESWVHEPQLNFDHIYYEAQQVTVLLVRLISVCTWVFVVYRPVCVCVDANICRIAEVDAGINQAALPRFCEIRKLLD